MYILIYLSFTKSQLIKKNNKYKYLNNKYAKIFFVLIALSLQKTTDFVKIAFANFIIFS